MLDKMCIFQNILVRIVTGVACLRLSYERCHARRCFGWSRLSAQLVLRGKRAPLVRASTHSSRNKVGFVECLRCAQSRNSAISCSSCALPRTDDLRRKRGGKHGCCAGKELCRVQLATARHLQVPCFLFVLSSGCVPVDDPGESAPFCFLCVKSYAHFAKSFRVFVFCFLLSSLGEFSAVYSASFGAASTARHVNYQVFVYPHIYMYFFYEL